MVHTSSHSCGDYNSACSDGRRQGRRCHPNGASGARKRARASGRYGVRGLPVGTRIPLAAAQFQPVHRLIHPTVTPAEIHETLRQFELRDPRRLPARAEPLQVSAQHIGGQVQAALCFRQDQEGRIVAVKWGCWNSSSWDQPSQWSRHATTYRSPHPPNCWKPGS